MVFGGECSGAQYTMSWMAFKLRFSYLYNTVNICRNIEPKLEAIIFHQPVIIPAMLMDLGFHQAVWFWSIPAA